MKNRVQKSENVKLKPKVDETDEIRKFIKQKELQNQVLKKLIKKIQDEKIRDK